MLIGEGKRTLDAYRQAGYEGKDHAAYELRSYLGDVLEKYLAARGFDKPRLMSEMATLLDIPLDPSVKTMDVKTRMKLLSEFNKMLGRREGKSESKKFTAIQINVNPPKPTAVKTDVIDV
jgi:hypothetical protein